MPYLLKAAPNGFFVETKGTGRKHSKLPLPRERAERQMRALYARMPGEASMARMKNPDRR
jgi:hypothetical protein